MSRPCRYCGGTGHSTIGCYARPKNRLIPHKTMKRIGKQGQKWIRFRAQWFKDNPGPYFCYYDGEPLKRNEVELDHALSRSRHPELRFDPNNIVVSCHFHNFDKGSRSAEEYLEYLKKQV